MAGNKVVATTTNRITFEIDNNSYKKAIERIKGLGREFTKLGDSLGKGNPLKAWQASMEKTGQIVQRVQNKQLQQQRKMHQEAVSQAKREAAVRSAIEKRENARRKQVVGQMTAKDPELVRMRKFYQEQSKLAKKSGGLGGSYFSNKPVSPRALSRANIFRYIPGNPNMGGVASNPALVRAQTAAMNRWHKQNGGAGGSGAPRRNNVGMDRLTHLTNMSTRLTARYGANFRDMLSGYRQVEQQYAKGMIGKSTFNAQIAAMQKGFANAAAGTMTLSTAFNKLRTTVMDLTKAYTAFSAIVSVNKSGHMMEGASAALTNVMGDPAKANTEVAFVQSEAMRLGFDLKSGLQGYAQMAVNAKNQMTGQEVRDLFSAYSQYAASYGADQVKYQRGIMAIQQMLGKGQVMSEELKQQLAEALPGAYDPFIKATKEAFGLSELTMAQFMDMMQKGQVKTAKIMKYVAKYMNEASVAGYERMQKSNVLAENRLKTFIELTKQKLFTTWSDELTEFYYTLIRTGETFTPMIMQAGEFVSGFIQGLNDIIGELNNTIVSIRIWWLQVRDHFGLLKKEVKDTSNTVDETFSKAKWVGYAFSILVVVSAVNRLLNIIKAVAATLGVIKAAGGIAGAIGGAAAGGAAAGGAAAMAKKGLFARLLGGLWKWKGPLALGYMGYEGAGMLDDWMQNYHQETDVTKHPQWLVDGVNGISSFFGLDYRMNNPITYRANPTPSTPLDPFQSFNVPPIPLEIGEGKITIEFDAAQFESMLDARFEWENWKDINLFASPNN